MIFTFAIYLDSTSFEDPSNHYGYYTGKCYTVRGEKFPCNTGKEITDKTKLYKSRKVAENAAKKLLDTCEYVTSYKITEVKN